MKLTILFVAFLALCLFEQAVGHKACTYRRVFNLKRRASSEDKCREACVNFDRKRQGKCFAYVYDPQSKECVGYTLDEHNSFTLHEECGLNPGVDLTLPPSSDAEPSYEGDVGCTFSFINLGIVYTKKACEALCTGFDEDNKSEVYGGCAAWFWDPTGEECLGMLSERASFGRDVCRLLD